VGVRRVVVVMDHANKQGQFKVLRRCTLPLTGQGVVDRIITDLCVLDVLPDDGGLRLVELAPGMTAAEVAARTGAALASGGIA
ncbi:MAG: CoA-transferase, partial [Brevundimonas sp.]